MRTEKAREHQIRRSKSILRQTPKKLPHKCFQCAKLHILARKLQFEHLKVCHAATWNKKQSSACPNSFPFPILFPLSSPLLLSKAIVKAGGAEKNSFSFSHEFGCTFLNCTERERERKLCTNVTNACTKPHCASLVITNISVKSTGALPVALQLEQL